MKPSTKTGALLLFASFALPCMAQSDDNASCAAKPRTSLERRVDREAMKGPVALRRFVSRTRMIHQLDYTTEASRFAAARNGENACEARRAGAHSVAGL